MLRYEQNKTTKKSTENENRSICDSDKKLL